MHSSINVDDDSEEYLKRPHPGPNRSLILVIIICTIDLLLPPTLYLVDHGTDHLLLLFDHDVSFYTFSSTLVDAFLVIVLVELLCMAITFIIMFEVPSSTTLSRALHYISISLSFSSLVFLSVKIHFAVVMNLSPDPFAVSMLSLSISLAAVQLILSTLAMKTMSSEYAAIPTKEEEDEESNGNGNGKAPEKKKKSHASVGRLLKLAKPELGLLSAGMVMLFVSSGSTLAMPAYFGKVVEAVTTTKSESELNEGIISLIIIFAIGSIATFFRSWWFTWAGQRLVARLRKNLFRAIIDQEVAFFDQNRTGELTNRLASDTQVLQNTLTVNVSMGVRYTAQMLGSVVLLFVTSWSLTLIMLGVVPIIAVGAVAYGRKIKTLSKQFQDELAKSASTAEEVISTIRTVRSFSQEPRLHAKYGSDIESSYAVGRRMAIANGSFMGAISMLSQSAIALVVYVGAKQVLRGTITTGSLTSFLLYTITVAFSFAFITSLFGDFMQAVGAADRIFELLDRKPLVNVEGGGKLPSIQGLVKLDNVTFSYPSRKDTDVLKGISLTLLPGTVLALVGPSGGGKSTIVNLIERYYDPSSGRITIDGVDIKTLDPRWFRSHIGFVSQEPVLFACSIRENIAFGVEDVNQQNIEEAAIKANAHQFIDSFPEKYDSLVGERGVRLSGGQKQRIAIARALLMNPRILLLDEATSALDAESEYLVQQAIDRLMQNRTVLVIAHRLSTVRNANQVVVISGGQIVEMGTHDQLLESKVGVYKKLVKRQLQAD